MTRTHPGSPKTEEAAGLPVDVLTSWQARYSNGMETPMQSPGLTAPLIGSSMTDGLATEIGAVRSTVTELVVRRKLRRCVAPPPRHGSCPLDGRLRARRVRPTVVRFGTQHQP